MTRSDWTVRLLVLSATAAAGIMPAAAGFLVSACNGVDGYAAAFEGRRTFLLKPAELAAIKAAPSAPAKEALAALIADADAALARRPGSVMDKTTIPLSDDRHDYLSLAPYWWPDPANPKGPYIRRDGEVNPKRDTKAFDRTALARMVSDADTLALAYYYTGDTRYAAKAAAVIRAWFLDPATAMNPNMNYAQAVPGRENGRKEGVLDTSGFMQVIDAAGLIGPSAALTPSEVQKLEGWFARYIEWMQTSANGRGEQAAKNNHGIWYDAQLTMFALFARRPEIARKTVAAFPRARIAAQFDPSGALPEELARTRSMHYSIYALEPAFDMADLAACLGTDLWAYADAKGRSLRKATDYLAAYRGRPELWKTKELDWPAEELDALLTRADAAWGPGAYPRTAKGRVLLRYRQGS